MFRDFLFAHMKRILYFFLVCDLSETLTVMSSIKMHNEHFAVKHYLPWVWAIQMYANVNMSYSLGAVVTTALGICSISEWPPMFGDADQNRL